MKAASKLIVSTPGCVLLIVILGFVVYSFMLNGSFRNMDDRFSIVESPFIKDPANIGKIFQFGFFKDQSYYRPLVSLSFMLEYQVFGLDAFFYYLDNVFLHLVSAVLVFFIIRMILGDTQKAFTTAFLFVVHPVQWEAVANIPGRSILLCSVFNLAAFLAYLNARRRGILWMQVLAWACFVASLLSKESAAMLPLVLLAYEMWLGKKSVSRRKRFLWVMPFFGWTFFYLLMRKSLGITQVFSWPTLRDHALGVLSFLRGTLTFLRIFVWPSDLHFDRSQKLLTAGDPQVFGTVLIYLIFIYALIRFRKRLSDPVKFFLFWFYAELIPVSQLVTAIGVGVGYISIAEHFLYIPSMGIFLLMSLLLTQGESVWPRQRWFSREMFYALRGAFFVALIITTVMNNIYATQELSMLKRSLHYDPTNARLLYSTGFYYADHRYFPEAEQYFRRVVALEPWNAQARIGLGKSLSDQGRYYEAVVEYEKVVNPGSLEELYRKNFKIAYDRMIKSYQDRIAQNPRDARLYYSLGVMYQKNGQLAEAIPLYEKAIVYDPNHKEAFFNLAIALATSGRGDEAKVFFQRVIELTSPDQELNRQSAYWLGVFSKPAVLERPASIK